MRGFLPRVFLVGCLLTACCFLCHCGVRHPGSQVFKTADRTNEAAQLLKTVLETNTQIRTIKGIGFVKLRQDNQLNSFRAAWIGSRPQKFRLEILAAIGQPVLSFASDGKRHYLLSYSDNRLYRRKASGNGLKRLIPIAITPEEILDLLSGRLPLHPDSRAAIEYRDGNSAPMLVLEARKGGGLERIIPGVSGLTAFRGMERYDRRGRLKFKAVFEKMREIGGRQIPEVLTITNDKGAMIQITVQRCWVNPVVSDDRFILKLPS